MRGTVRNSFGLFGAVVFLTACASAVPPSRLGDYVSSERRVCEEAPTRQSMMQRRTSLMRRSCDSVKP